MRHLLVMYLMIACACTRSRKSSPPLVMSVEISVPIPTNICFRLFMLSTRVMCFSARREHFFKDALARKRRKIILFNDSSTDTNWQIERQKNRTKQHVCWGLKVLLDLLNLLWILGHSINFLDLMAQIANMSWRLDMGLVHHTTILIPCRTIVFFVCHK